MEITNAAPRFTTFQNSKGDTIGLENFALVTILNLDTWIGYIKEIKEEYPNRILIGSIMVEVVKDEWQDLAIKVASSGVDALELNFSCPHGMPEKGIGAAIGQDPNITKQITEWVKEVVTIPVLVKLTPNVTNIVEIANSAKLGLMLLLQSILLSA